MHVPETPIDVDDLPQSWENKIRGARQRTDMQTVTVSQGMHEPANKKFRGCVLRLHRRHDSGSLSFRDSIRHDKRDFTSGLDRH